MRTGFAAVICAICAMTAVAQEQPRQLTLEQALQAAIKNHPALARVQRQTAEARARVQQAKAGMMPSIAVQGAATDGPLGAPAFGLQGLAGDPLKKHFGGGLNLVQPLFDSGRTQHLVASRRLLVQAAEQDEETQKAAVLLAVQEAYLGVLRARQLVAVQQESVRQREESLRQARTFSEAGLKADVDAQLAQADLADAQTALLSAQNVVSAGFAALNNAMGQTSLTRFMLVSPEPTPEAALDRAPLPSVEEVTRLAVRQRPELRAADLQARAAGESVQAARSDLLPRLDSIASVGAIAPSSVIPQNKEYAVGIAATIPLYTGGAVEGRVAEERERREAALASRRELEEAVKLQATRAWLNVQTRTEQVKVARQQAEAAGASMEQAGERYRLQLSSYVELVTAESAATRARAQLVDAVYDLELARAELDWAMGATYLKYGKAR